MLVLFKTILDDQSLHVNATCKLCSHLILISLIAVCCSNVFYEIDLTNMNANGKVGKATDQRPDFPSTRRQSACVGAPWWGLAFFNLIHQWYGLKTSREENNLPRPTLLWMILVLFWHILTMFQGLSDGIPIISFLTTYRRMLRANQKVAVG